MKTLTEKVLKLLVGCERPLSVPEIAEKLREDPRKVSSVISKLFRTGRIKGSQMVTTLVLKETRGGWKYSRFKIRYYTHPEGPSTYTVKIKRFDRRLNRNVEEEVVLILKFYDEVEREEKTEVSTKVYEYLKSVDVAKFSGEIAEELNIDKGKVRSALVKLAQRGKIRKKGVFDRTAGKEVKFPQGYLYFIDEEQYKKRLQDLSLVLSDRDLAIYNEIKTNCEVYGRFTRMTELAEKFSISLKRFEWLMKRLESRTDVKSIEIQKEKFFYIPRFFTKETFENQVEYWREVLSKEQSERTAIGRAHEVFAELVISEAFERGDLKLTNYFWEFRLDGNVKKYNVFKRRFSNPRRTYEFDRVLHAFLSPFSTDRFVREIIFIFESKYWKNPKKEHWVQFLKKIADTYDFGTDLELLAPDGRIVTVRAPKLNIIPVMILSWQGRPFKYGDKELTLAQLINLQGGLVIFTSELEKYFAKIVGEPVSFRKLFKDWFFQKYEKDFAQFIMEKYADKIRVGTNHGKH